MLRQTSELDAPGFSLAGSGQQKAPALVDVDRASDGASATIANAHLLFNSDFVRTGSDLHINGHDGERAVVRDYFGPGERAALMSAEGARLSPDLIDALTKSVAPHQYAQATPATPSASDAVGRVVTASADSTILRNGVPVTVRPGDAVLRADVLQTAGGAMAVSFNDGSTLNLTANTRIVVSEFIYSPNGTGNSQLLDLVQGSLTFISGEVAHSGDMRIGTPVATMGIRGTVGGVTTANDGTVQFYVSQSATGAVIINQQGQIIANVVQDGPMIVVRPVGPLQVIADEIQKSPAQLAVELQALQQIVNIKTVGDQLLQQFLTPQQPSPNPQSPQGGPHTTIPADDKLKITLFTDDGPPAGGVTPPTHAVIELVTHQPDAPPPIVAVPIPVNLPPVTFAPLSASTAEDSPLSFSGISIVDGDSQTITVKLSVTHGVLSLSGVAGLSFSAGDGAGDGTMTFSGSPAAVNAALHGLTYTPSQDYNGSAEVVIVTTDGNAPPVTTHVQIDVTPVNDAPVIEQAGCATVTFTENDCPVIVDSSLTLSDVDSTTLTGATVTIAGNFHCGEDVLSFTAQCGITGSFDPQSGVLTLSGEASLADYEAVLRSVTYENTSNHPSADPRTIEFQVNDGSSEHALSNVVSATVDVSPTNNAPELAIGAAAVADEFGAQSYNLNSGTVNWTSGWVENENGDYAPSPTTGEIQVRTDPATSDSDFRLFLSDDDNESGAADTIQRSADLSGAASATLTFDYRRQIEFGDPDDVVKVWASTDGVNFTLVGEIGATGYGTYIDEGYQQFTLDISDYISPTTTIRFSVDDGVDNGDEFYIDNVKIEYGATPTYVEGGDAVSIAPFGATIKDVDNATLQSATITLTNAEAGDLLSVSGQLPGGIVASSYDPQTGVLTLTGEATLADYQAALAQIRFSSTSDTPSGADRVITVVVSDGAADSNTGTVTVHVTPTNDAPENTVTGALSVDEDTNLSINGLQVADADAGAASITTTLSVAHGTLSFGSSQGGASITGNGTAVVIITGTVAQINATLASTDNLTYRADANYNGTDTLTVSTDDGGNSGSGGAQSDVDTVTITVAPVNDAPQSPDSANPATFTEDTDTVIPFSALLANASDPDGDTLSIIDVATSSAYGGTVSVNGTDITYHPAANFNGFDYFTYSVTDGQETITRAATFTVGAVNDAAVVDLNGSAPGGDGAASFTEQTAVLIAPAATIVDVDSANLSSLRVTLAATPNGADEALSLDANATQAASGLSVNYDPQTRALTISGDATVATYETILRGVLYNNASDAPDTSARSISVVAAEGGAGTSLFRTQVTYGSGAGTVFTAAADFNGDGKLDIATANFNGGNVSVLLGNGAGGLASHVDYSIGNAASGLAIGDFNGDGKLDIAASAFGGSNNVAILLGHGDGTFDSSVSYSAGVNPYSLAAADINGDGKLDLVVADSDSSSFSVLLGDGNGAFASAIATSVAAQPFSVAVGDLNGDGKADVVSVASDTGRVLVNLGNGDGTFAGATADNVGSYPRTVKLADVNADGKLDIVTANQGSSDVSVLLGHGDGTFGTATNFAAGPSAFSVTIADVNGDGNVDIVTANISNATASVLLGDGQGGFGPKTDYAVGDSVRQVTVADLNNDGTADLIAANAGVSTVSVLLGDAPVASDPHSIALDVTPVNDAPQSSDSANPATFTEDTDTVIPFSALLANASDPDGDTLSIINVATSSAYGGTVSVSGTDITYHPAANFTGFDYFVYSVTDGNGGTITRAATFTVGAVNDAPVAAVASATYSATEQTSLTLKGSGLSISDVDAGSGSTTVTLAVTEGVLNAAAGDSGASVSGDGTSSLTITGTAAQINGFLGASGTSTLSYINNSDAPPASVQLTLSVDDNGNSGSGGALSDTATATINVAPVNDAPQSSDSANPAIFTEDTDTVIPFSALLANASDPDGDTLSIINVATSSAYGGTVSVSGTDITYHPAANFTGFDYFVYSVTDGNGGTITRAATFTVGAVNDAPVLDTHGAALSYSEAQAAAAIAPSITVTDVDSTQLTGAKVQITGNFAASEDVLGFADQNGITGSYNSTTGLLTLTGIATLAQYQTALASVTYANTSALSTATRTVSFTADDGQTLNHASDTVTVDVSVAAVNDTLNLSATAWAASSSIDLGGGANVVNVLADGADISAGGTPAVSHVDTGNLTGTGGNDSITLTGLQLDNIIIGNGVIALGAGSADIINLKSTSAGLNTLGATDASITGVEAVSASGAGAGVTIDLHGQSEGFTITGSANADTLIGGSGADTINGGDGNDVMTGGAGADNLNGGIGADVFVMTAPGDLTGDIIDGVHDNANDDTIRLDAAGTYDFSVATVSNIDSVNIATNAAGFNVILTDDMASTAAYKGTNTAIEGRIRVNATVAVSNDVTIDASDIQAGHRLFVNASNLNGNDTIIGGAGDDNIGGGAGSDTITGGAGNDSLTGGAGADTFVFHAGFGIDTVSDFNETLDYLQFDQSIFADVTALLAATTDSGANTVIQYDASNKVTLEGVHKADLQAHTDHILIV